MKNSQIKPIQGSLQDTVPCKQSDTHDETEQQDGISATGMCNMCKRNNSEWASM